MRTLDTAWEGGYQGRGYGAETDENTKEGDFSKLELAREGERQGPSSMWCGEGLTGLETRSAQFQID